MIQNTDNISFLKAVLEAIPACVYVQRADFTIPYYNHKFKEAFGSPEGKKCFEVLRALKEPCEGCPSTAKCALGEAREWKFTSPFGPQYLVQETPFVYEKDTEGAAKLKILTDITEIEQVRARLKASEERHRAIVEAAQDAIIAADTDGNIVFWNSAAERIFGYSRDEVKGMTVFDTIVPEKYHETKLEAMARFKETGTGPAVGKTLELTAKRKDGKELPVSLSLSAYKYKSAHIALAVIRDISVQKALEVQLNQAQKIQAIGTLAAGVAHEINTPAQFIGDNLSFLKDSLDRLNKIFIKVAELNTEVEQAVSPESFCAELKTLQEQVDLNYLRNEMPRALSESLEGIERISDIVKAIKSFAHPGSDAKQSSDINKIIKNTITVSRNEWKYVADIEVDLDSNLPKLLCLEAEINQVILNLIVNAAHAIKARALDGKGLIKISTASEDQYAVISVADNGSGMPEAVKAKIFDPFFTTKEVGRGTGQGLTIVHSVVVDKHQGSITCESEVDKGSTFTVKLPLTQQ
jgi:two-component system NtrC family sensor kinase